MNLPRDKKTLSPCLEIFYWQYKQQLAFEFLSFPAGDTLLEPAVQRDLHSWFFPRAPTGERAWATRGPRYEKRVLKEVVARMEAAVTDPEEQEVIDPLMEELAYLSSFSGAVDSSPSTAQATGKAILVYTLPLPSNDAKVYDRRRSTVFLNESPNLLSSNGTTGHRTWPASLHLATYLSTTAAGRALITRKSVLELGAGTGLLSLICAGLLRAAYVLATDGNADLVAAIAPKNLELNHELATHHFCGRLPLEARQLVWGPDADLSSLFEGDENKSSLIGPPSLPEAHDFKGLVQRPSAAGYGLGSLYDTVLAADVTYDVDLVGDLAVTLAGLVKLCPQADVLVSATVRNEETWDAFLSACLDLGLIAMEVEFKAEQVEKQTGLFYGGGENMRIVKIQSVKRGRA